MHILNNFNNISDKNGSTNVFFELPGDNALNKDENVTSIYLGFDTTNKEDTSYFHHKYYNLSTIDSGHILHTPQFNHISFQVGFK